MNRDLSYAETSTGVVAPEWEWWEYREMLCARDGWWAAFLLGVAIFGPRTAPMAVLPPLRFMDAVLLVFLLGRWAKSVRLYGGFLLSYRVRPLQVFLPLLAVLTFLSTLLGTLSGRNPFLIKDYFAAINIFRMFLLAAVAASFYFGPRQVRQFAIGVLFLAFSSAALALVQKFRSYWVADLLERFYALEWTRLRIAERGTASRVIGTFGNPNQFSSCLIYLTGATLSVLIFSRATLRMMAVGAFAALSLAALVTTGSRTGYVSFLVVLVTGCVLCLRGRSLVSALIAIVLMVGLFVFVRAHAAALSINPRMQQLIEGQALVDASLFARFRLWADSLAQAKESLLFGVGVSKRTFQTTDNGYIMTLMRIGVLGAGVYVAMLLVLLAKAFRSVWSRTESPARLVVLAVLLGMINHMVFELTADFFWTIQLSEMFSIFAGILCGVCAQLRWEEASGACLCPVGGSEVLVGPDYPAGTVA